jgi:hypothetical protein
MSKADDDQLNRLFSRVMSDDGPEGLVALNLLRKAVAGRQVTLSIQEGVGRSPSRIIHDQDSQIADLEERIQALQNAAKQEAQRAERVARGLRKMAGQ